jgi:hypothetical protein
MSLSYRNNQVYAPRSNVTVEDDLYETTPVHNYDLNSILPAPSRRLETNLVAVEPLIVSSEPCEDSLSFDLRPSSQSSTQNNFSKHFLLLREVWTPMSGFIPFQKGDHTVGTDNPDSKIPD